jgi:DNA-directed RNA polymerase specialized sigma24 family protein
MGPTNNPGIEVLLEHDWLNRLACHLASEDIAEDPVQETWMSAAHNPPDADRPARPGLAPGPRNFLRRRTRPDSRRRRREDACTTSP